ncbi:MAG: SRPBCC family protein [Spirochaetales bacterium]|nr:SRPBCC family protein [Spirochaetales bacterium]
MNIQVQVNIDATKENVWKIITDIEGSVNNIKGIEKIEIMEKNDNNFIGLKWKETRTMFGQTATEVMWITDSKENEYYTTRAESHGAIYKTELRLTKDGESTNLTMNFGAEFVTIKAKLMSFMGLLFISATKKALKKDLNDIKTAVEAK